MRIESAVPPTTSRLIHSRVSSRAFPCPMEKVTDGNTCLFKKFPTLTKSQMAGMRRATYSMMLFRFREAGTIASNSITPKILRTKYGHSIPQYATINVSSVAHASGQYHGRYDFIPLRILDRSWMQMPLSPTIEKLALSERMTKFDSLLILAEIRFSCESCMERELYPIVTM